MDFVNDVDLIAAGRGLELDIFPQCADLFNAAIRRAVDLENVHGTSLLDLFAGNALAAGFFGGAFFAVERFGEDARRRGFSDATRAGKKEALRDAFLTDRVL